ncbi:LysR family transcriptional regulator ArgP [Pokkaliibacter sp. MBI-7]|uniref:LysR family transcriptional regulator ArgP n=1 Tax=Pokkaliibacter sp. MBI-7 TaxID=3040600 RepID=UPI00244ABDC1|nr:LysR family transcriptional regulator ArgP [Pokkaliibacter sp. MBI-7]MDH2433371.1 LysR family transcriptional regulator ArgP [Pokkaliibacter sp. MBI-7]
MLDYKLLEALAAVIQQQSFERAADVLCLTQSAVSQRIRLLEERLGQPVLVRSTPIRPTELGQKLFHHVQQVQVLEQSLSTDIRPTTDSYTRLRLAVNADSLAIWLMPVFADLFHEHKVLMELMVEDQDCTLARLKSGEVIGCVSAQDTLVPGCNRLHLGVMDYIWVCTPAFAQRFFASGVNADSLRQAPAVAFDRDDQLHVRFVRQHFNLTAGDIDFHMIPTVEGFIDAIRYGMAYGFVPRSQIRQELASGKLINPTPELKMPVPLYWHHWRLQTPMLARLGSLLEKAARQYLQ